jgi:malonate-semialdehyde dehydrogenase (acetylating) / methylmalonate-semialdehyde dehydrogenase
MQDLFHFIGGQRVAGASQRFCDGFEPMSGATISRVPLASREEVAAAVASAEAAQPAWAALSPQRRARVLMKFLDCVAREAGALARLLAREHGKTIGDARGDIQRGLEVVEFAIGAPHFLKGAFSDGGERGIDLYSMRQPLGVAAGVTPFNFPAMLPMWMFAPAIACGNAFVLKPSERDASVPLRLAELMMEAGLPEGVLNVVNGDKEAVDALLDHAGVRALSFVGSTAVAQYVYARGAASGKRMQCFGGAKNHMIVMPDADLDSAVEALVGAAYGAAGERCMAISVAVPVGEAVAEALIERLVPRVKALRIGASTDAQADFGPLVTQAHLERVTSYIGIGVREGAALLVDGRNFELPGYERGFYLGSCLLDRVTRQMRVYREEIFGPVLVVLRAANYAEALELANDHEYGNGVAIFTRDGGVARDFVSKVKVGMVGVNVPIPVPLAHYSFGGWKRSFFGDLGQHGPDSMRFYTKTKTVTSRWPAGAAEGASFVIPTTH